MDSIESKKTFIKVKDYQLKPFQYIFNCPCGSKIILEKEQDIHTYFINEFNNRQKRIHWNSMKCPLFL